MLKYDELMSGIETPELQEGTESVPFTPAGVAFGIATSFLIAPVLNGILDVMDPNVSSRGNTSSMISNNVIDLTCITSDDLSNTTVKDYCKSLEVIYAMMIRSLISSQTRSRLRNGSGSVFRDIPIQNAYDGLQLDKDGNIGSFVSNWFKGRFRAPLSGKAAVGVFNESKIIELEKEYLKLTSHVGAGLEADPFLKETRGAGPKFIDVELSTTDLAGKAAKKNISIGVAVRPKMVSATDIYSFMVKRDATTLEADRTAKVGFLKSVAKLFSKEKVVKDAQDSSASGKAASKLYGAMQKIKGIKKPFVCLLISSEVADELKDRYKIDIMNPGVMRSLYKNYPIMSIGIYNSDRDKFFISITPDAPMNEYTASELSSEISGYEKQLADIVRSKAYTSY